MAGMLICRRFVIPGLKFFILGRFIRKKFQGQPVLTDQPINPKWRPCVRADSETTIVSTVMRQVHRITYRFLDYLARIGIGIRNQPAPVVSNMPKTPLEMDWLLAHLENRRSSNLHHEVCRFLLAAARYTDIPMVDLADDGRGAGLLSQFMTYPRPPRSGDPPRCSPWVFIDNPGAPPLKRSPALPQIRAYPQRLRSVTWVSRAAPATSSSRCPGSSAAELNHIARKRSTRHFRRSEKLAAGHLRNASGA